MGQEKCGVVGIILHDKTEQNTTFCIDMGDGYVQTIHSKLTDWECRRCEYGYILTDGNSVMILDRFHWFKEEYLGTIRSESVFMIEGFH